MSGRPSSTHWDVPCPRKGDLDSACPHLVFFRGWPEHRPTLAVTVFDRGRKRPPGSTFSLDCAK